MDITWDEEHDVVVVGSGAAAMAGAWQAARSGLSTVVLEKTSLLGGTSAYSGAACWLPGTDVQRRAGIGDSTESGRTYLRALLGEHEVEKQEAFLETAPDWWRHSRRIPRSSSAGGPSPTTSTVPVGSHRVAPSCRSTCRSRSWAGSPLSSGRSRTSTGPDGVTVRDR